MKSKIKNYKIWITVGIVIIILLIITVRKKPIESQYIVIKKQEVLETVLASGKVAGRMVVPLSFPKSGTVERTYIREGAVVKAGDTLMALKNAEEKNAISQRYNAINAVRVSINKLTTTDAAQAQAQLEEATSSAEAAQKQFERISSLYTSKIVTQQELEQAKRDNDVALSAQTLAEAAVTSLQSNQKQLLDLQLGQAQLSLEEAKIVLSHTAILALEPGRVIKIFVNTGELVSPASPVISFLPTDTTTHVELQIDEDEVYRIKSGQKAIIGLPSLPESTFAATVQEIVPFVDATRGTITIQCAIGPISHIFIADQTVSAQIITGSIPEGITLEKRFVIQKNGLASVFLLSKGRAISRTISVKDIGNGLMLVTGGLVEGDTVLFAITLVPNAKVKLRESK
jgi:HlyD family secretion protein